VGAIEIKTPSLQQATPLLRSAIELEKKLVRDSLMLTNERIAELASRAGVEPDQFLAGTVARHEDNELLLIELEGERSQSPNKSVVITGDGGAHFYGHSVRAAVSHCSFGRRATTALAAPRQRLPVWSHN
jgi:hypothetical protein